MKAIKYNTLAEVKLIPKYIPCAAFYIINKPRIPFSLNVNIDVHHCHFYINTEHTRVPEQNKDILYGIQKRSFLVNMFLVH